MKRFLSVLLCLSLIALPLLLRCVPALAEGANIQVANMPDEVKKFFASSQFDGWTVGAASACVIESSAGSHYFAVAQKNGNNVLYGFEKKSGQYDYWLKTGSCLPQGKGSFVVRYASGYLYLISDGPLDLGDSLDILFTEADNEEQGHTELFFQASKNGQFLLKLLCYDYCWSEAVFTDDSITYYHEGEFLGTVYGTVERNLRYFSLSAFPHTVKEARNKLTQAPFIPSGELTAQKIKFTGGQKFPVYSGPGAEYERAANGKASVSTNDWIQVFGSENGYILIQYALDASQMRFGYIDQSSLPKSASVSPLRFAWTDAEIISSTYLTDDPLNSQTRTRTLNAGQQVKWLATMGNWVYVELTGSGQPIRGFVPSGAIRKASAYWQDYASFRNSTYSADATVTVRNGVTAEIIIVVTGPAAWSQAGADNVTGYQVYANNVPLFIASASKVEMNSAGHYTYVDGTATLPTGTTVLGLCPVHAQSGLQAGEMITVILNDITK
ncbi:MAG: hypothetical protein IJQ33_01420 [Clostridia bacterium]|nr:hypothetical protein [Clostridia bacterium]